jgi:hypothetical protein
MRTGSLEPLDGAPPGPAMMGVTSGQEEYYAEKPGRYRQNRPRFNLGCAVVMGHC